MLRGGLIASGEFLMSEEGEGALGFLYETRCGCVCVLSVCFCEDDGWMKEFVRSNCRAVLMLI